MATTTLHHQIWISAPAHTVYEAVSTAEGLSQWWGEHKSTFEPGGSADQIVVESESEAVVVNDDALVEATGAIPTQREYISHSPGEIHGLVVWQVLDRVPDRMIAFECVSEHSSESPASAWTGTKFTILVTEKIAPSWMDMGDAPVSVVDLTHTGWDEESPYLGFCNTAWGEVMTMLKTHCESPKAA